MATIAPYGVYQAFDDNGDPLAGGKLYTYEAGTTTPKPTYTDYTGLVANTNPVILDASGMANVWIGDGGYKFVLKDANDVTIFTTDGIGGTTDTAFGAEVNLITSNEVIDSTYANSANIVTGNTTLSLQSATILGEGFYISVKNGGSGTVTIDPDGGETIDGAATKTLNPGQSALVISTGTTWYTFFYADLTAGGNNTFTGNNTFSGSATFTGNVITPDDGELTIASGVITVTGVYHTVDTEGDAATDNLDTINGGTDGQALILRTENDARDVVITSAGNISSGGSANVTLGNSNDVIVLKYDGEKSKWLIESATASQGTKADTALQPGGAIIAATTQVTTSGTAFDFVIPSGVKQVSVNFNNCSLTGTDEIIVQLGDSGGVETTGYGSLTGTDTTVVASTVGFATNGLTAANGVYGALVLNLEDTTTWIAHGVIRYGSARINLIAGIKTLDSALTTIRVTRTGTNTFDGGSVNLTYNG